MGRLSLLLAASAVAAFLVAAPGPSSPASEVEHALPATPLPQLGIVYGSPGSSLVRIDPRTLRVRPGRQLDVGPHASAWSFSRDGARLALGGDLDSAAIPSVLVVDTPRLRALGQVRLAKSGWIRATAWLPDGRLVAVVSVFGSTSVTTDIATVDASGTTVLERQSFPGQVLRVARSQDGLVALLASTRSLEPARLAIVEPSGTAEVIVLDRIPAGSKRRLDGRGGAEFSQREPALAVDPVGRKAFVIGSGGDVAQVDLRTRAVSYHRLSRRVSIVDRLRAWLEPTATAKSVEGPTRWARWLGRSLIAVSGGDYSVESTGGRPRLRFAPSGLELVDTRRWTVRKLGSGTDTIWPAGDLLLAGFATWSSELQLPRPPGLVVYSAAGRERGRLYEGKRVWVVHADARRAYVRVDRRVEVVDLASGRVLERRPSAPYPLVPPGAPTES